LAFSGYKAREDEESQGEELGKTGGNWTRKPEVKKSKARGKKTENRRNWSKIQRKNPRKQGKAEHELHISSSSSVSQQTHRNRKPEGAQEIDQLELRHRLHRLQQTR
jgi:hypothetical protein